MAREGCYVDCYVSVVPGQVNLPVFITHFYQTWLFRIERWLLARGVKKPSTDADARAIANGTSQKFAVWELEGRTDNQLLLCDISGRTRSWFMVEPAEDQTKIYFGSVVVPPAGGTHSIGPVFTALMGFHKLYSRALLTVARRSLIKAGGS
ncbi:hypothetical protein FIL88_06860 [Aliiroseovarius halocynthiae]|uniref:SRPBCC family protein n=1 Tax=Aliiroseovarius halocynthiae TaxID=985055 RepID=A0A545SX86_9RHOB|nr:hypothetical protein FIL88_06860 [Aliiroseovarius halocynthiae]